MRSSKLGRNIVNAKGIPKTTLTLS